MLKMSTAVVKEIHASDKTALENDIVTCLKAHGCSSAILITYFPKRRKRISLRKLQTRRYKQSPQCILVLPTCK